MQQMVNCPNCGSQNNASQQYCVSCGAHLADQPISATHTPVVSGVVNPAPVVQRVNPAAVGIATPNLQRGQVEVRPTWGLAWGIFWRLFFIVLMMGGLVFLCYMMVRLIMGYNDLFGPW